MDATEGVTEKAQLVEFVTCVVRVTEPPDAGSEVELAAKETTVGKGALVDAEAAVGRESPMARAATNPRGMPTATTFDRMLGSYDSQSSLATGKEWSNHERETA